MCTGRCSSNSAHSWLSQGALWAEDTSAMPEHQVILLQCPLLLIIFSEWLVSYISLMFITVWLETVISSICTFGSLSYFKPLYLTITCFIICFEVEMISICMWFWENIFISIDLRLKLSLCLEPWPSMTWRRRRRSVYNGYLKSCE